MMNKFVYYFFFLMATSAVVFLTSCEDDTETPGGDPSISLNPSDGIKAAPGDTVEVAVTLTNVEAGTEATVVSDPGGTFVGDNTVASGESIAFVIPETAQIGAVYTLTFSVTSGGAQANEQLDITIGYGTVVDVITKSDDFSILAAALTEADLVTLLQEAGPYTVFAPTNAAFDAMGITADNVADFEGLAEILSYHIVNGTAVMSTDLSDGQYLATEEGDSVLVNIDGDAVLIDDATVVSADVEADNGVVHAIDKVLLPQNISSYAATLLYPPNANQQSETFFASVSGNTYSYDEVTGTADPISADIDFGYFYGGTIGASLISADDALWSNPVPTGVGYNMDTWGTRNATEFRNTTLTAADFDAINIHQDFTLTGEYDVATAPANPKRVTGLAVGDVVAFKTADERFGLIKVVSITGTNGISDNIEIEVKVTR